MAQLYLCDPQQLNTIFHQVGLSIAICGRARKLFETMENQQQNKWDEIKKAFEEGMAMISESDYDENL